uniref:ORF1p n=1 Tax=Salicornia europaea amalgavirus 1 TaxID=2069328 RepID=A0A2V0A0R1_9VIRU|nr:TPA_inf: ORF1p [Salicornia europaea amalgavirus 1]
MSGAMVPQEHTLELSSEQEAAQILQAAAPLIEMGVPAGVFDRNAAIASGHSFKSFLKLVKFVSSFHEQGILEELIVLGATKQIYRIQNRMTQEQFVKLARFLQSAEGNDTIFAYTKAAKFQRKAGEVLTPLQIQMNDVFSMMRQEYGRVKKAKREEHERKIDELRKMLRLAEKEMKDDLEKIDREYAPVSTYQEPLDDQLGRAAWELYEADAVRNNRTVKNRILGGMEYARQHFGQKARELAQIDFASKEENRDAMERFLKKKFLSFRASADTAGERQVKIYLAGICGEKAVAEAVAEEAATFEADTNRNPPRAGVQTRSGNSGGSRGRGAPRGGGNKRKQTGPGRPPKHTSKYARDADVEDVSDSDSTAHGDREGETDTHK